MICFFCGVRLGDERPLEWRGRTVSACAWCDHCEVAHAVQVELRQGVPCARLGPLQAATGQPASALRELLAGLVARGVLVVDGDADTTWGWRLAEGAA